MDIELARSYRAIMDAERPEQLFGGVDLSLPPRMLRELLSKEEEILRKRVQPALFMNPLDRDAAAEALVRLDQLRDEAFERSAQGIFALPQPEKPDMFSVDRVLTFGEREYRMGGSLGTGSHSERFSALLLYRGRALGEVVVKVARAPEYSPQLLRENSILALLHDHQVPQWKHLPLVLDRFESGSRIGLVQRLFKGISLAELSARPQFRAGLDQRHVLWMLDRVLSTLGYVHRLGVVHGALDTSHVLVAPDTHNCFVCGWSTATTPSLGSSGTSGRSPVQDLVALGQIATQLLGDAQSVAEEVRSFLNRLQHFSAGTLWADAWELADELATLRERLFGRRFLPLVIR